MWETIVIRRDARETGSLGCKLIEFLNANNVETFHIIYKNEGNIIEIVYKVHEPIGVYL